MEDTDCRVEVSETFPETDVTLSTTNVGSSVEGPPFVTLKVSHCTILTGYDSIPYRFH